MSSHGSHRHAEANRMLWAIGITGTILVLEAVGGVRLGLPGAFVRRGTYAHRSGGPFDLPGRHASRGSARQRHPYLWFRQAGSFGGLGKLHYFFPRGRGRWLGSDPTVFRSYGFRIGKPWAASLWSGIIANGFCAWFLHGAEQDDLNVQSAFLHVMGDLASSVGVLAGAW